MKNFPEVLQDIYQRLAITSDEIGMSSDEIYAYVKKFNLNKDTLYSFIKDKLTEPKKKEEGKFTEADYLEMIKLSRSPEFADSMVFYKGKVLGRCPAGTKKLGKTCAPSQSNTKSIKYKKQSLGGLSSKQVEALSKAKTVEQIIEAHKKEQEQEQEKND